MIRGTTPIHTYDIPFDVSLIADLRVSYAQNGKEVVVKKKEDVTLDGNTITVELSQAETFLFDCGKRVVDIQVRVLTVNGDALCSNVMTMQVEKCLNNEVLTK